MQTVSSIVMKSVPFKMASAESVSAGVGIVSEYHLEQYRFICIKMIIFPQFSATNVYIVTHALILYKVNYSLHKSLSVIHRK